MKKLRPAPIFTIEGTSFVVDIEKQVLRQTNDQSNEISFIRDMQDKTDHYLLIYDTGLKRSLDGPIGPGAIRAVKVPQLVELDPEGMAEKYGFSAKELEGKTDFEIIVDQEALTLRHEGVLPRVNIAGEDFIVDLRLQELRHARHFFPVISLKSFELTADGWKYEAYYHPLLRQVVAIDPKLTEYPEGVIKIRIPNELGLDPVGTARAYGIDERKLLRRYPIQKLMNAEMIPLSETHIPALIRRNRKQLQKEHQENARRIRPRHRPHF
jgi:hypothetical protein